MSDYTKLQRAADHDFNQMLASLATLRNDLDRSLDRLCDVQQGLDAFAARLGRLSES